MTVSLDYISCDKFATKLTNYCHNKNINQILLAVCGFHSLAICRNRRVSFRRPTRTGLISIVVHLLIFYRCCVFSQKRFAYNLAVKNTTKGEFGFFTQFMLAAILFFSKNVLLHYKLWNKAFIAYIFRSIKVFHSCFKSFG